MNFLFFIVHPSKYHVFKHLINSLKNQGHSVEILITSKDVLEELVLSEGWKYKNIFPEGRKLENFHPYVGALINGLRTIYRLVRYVSRKKYNLFITDDLLGVVGKIRNVPTYLFQDDDLSNVPESSLLMMFSDYILSPECTDLGLFNTKKISYASYKELGGLHPNRFTPDESIVNEVLGSQRPYFLIRLVSLKAVHDVGKKGLSHNELSIIIRYLEKRGRVYISSERNIPSYLEKYQIKIEPKYLPHILFYSKLFIGDSQTMCSEAGVLGTPFIRYNDFVGKVSTLNEIENKYGLGYGVKVGKINELVSHLKYLTEDKSVNKIWKKKREVLLGEKVDLTDFLLSIFLEEGQNEFNRSRI